MYFGLDRDCFVTDLIRVVIVSSLPAVRAGLRALIVAPGVQVVDEAVSLAELEAFSSLVDVILISEDALVIPELRRKASQAEGQLAILVLLEEARLARELQRLPLRAWGVLSLDCTAEELAAALSALGEGLWVADPALVQVSPPHSLADQEDASQATAEALTEREHQVLQLLARGLANKQIGASLGISEHTVKFHISSIYTKLGVANRADAVRRGIQHGWILI